eukprot:PLAT13169.1.p1 GENE.PLAT13169.1~~PLAT13169.1.p1  ORF type:complete len:357 (-),score=154.76 PLAT13169.1:120-1190(-)
MSWCTIESDPGVFTELIGEFGVKGVQVEELYSLDDASFAPMRPVYGLVFLFKWMPTPDDRPTLDAAECGGLFFAKQVVTNACATQALLSILLNREDVDIGETLSDFKAFTTGMTPDVCGELIGASPEIRTAHNSFARPEPFVMTSKVATEKDDVFHFLSYVSYGGMVYELDGLKAGPILIGEAGDDWIATVRPEIERRISAAAGDIHFNLMALVRNRKEAAEEVMAVASSRISRIEAKLASLDGGAAMDVEAADGDEGFALAEDADGLRAQLVEATTELSESKDIVSSEERKFEKWRVENERRKHNYLPFAVELLKQLSKAGKLDGLIEHAKERTQARVAAAEEKKKAEAEAGGSS